MTTPAQIEIIPVPGTGAPELVAVARTLMGEYAAMPHTVRRWLNPAADIAALPNPYVLPHGVLLLARDGLEFLGSGALRVLEPAIGEIKRVYVRPSARGRGVGEAITNHLLDHAMQLGFDRVRLDTAPELIAARKLYLRLGFVPIPRYSPDQIPDTVCFELRIRPG